MKNSKSSIGYIVRNANRRFLNQRTFTGRTPNMWGPLAEAHVFANEATAQIAASSINRRPKRRANAAQQQAVVVAVSLAGRR